MVSKMAADQLFMAPLGTACFFAWTKATEGKADEAVPFIKVGLPVLLCLPVVLVYVSFQYAGCHILFVAADELVGLARYHSSMGAQRPYTGRAGQAV